jgi:phage shock protein E
MDWKFPLLVGLIVAAFFLLKRLTLVSARTARDLLKAGAAIVDVRSPAEFKSGHVPGAVNISLDNVREGVSRRFPDKDGALLLHCLSGTRSAMAARVLKAGGYTRVFNLGSILRARRIVRGAAHSK